MLNSQNSPGMLADRLASIRHNICWDQCYNGIHNQFSDYQRDEWLYDKLGDVVLIGSGAHPASYPMGTGGYFPGAKRQGYEADNLPATSAEVKNTWIYTSTLPYVFMA
jgi:hypothetical protein